MQSTSIIGTITTKKVASRNYVKTFLDAKGSPKLYRENLTIEKGLLL